MTRTAPLGRQCVPRRNDCRTPRTARKDQYTAMSPSFRYASVAFHTLPAKRPGSVYHTACHTCPASVDAEPQQPIKSTTCSSKTYRRPRRSPPE